MSTHGSLISSQQKFKRKKRKKHVRLGVACDRKKKKLYTLYHTAHIQSHCGGFKVQTQAKHDTQTAEIAYCDAEDGRIKLEQWKLQTTFIVCINGFSLLRTSKDFYQNRKQI